VERHASEVASETRELAGQLPVSDTAILLGVSKGRITQLQVPRPRAAHEGWLLDSGCVLALTSQDRRGAAGSVRRVAMMFGPG
jgi:hypothetical protein